MGEKEGWKEGGEAFRIANLANIRIANDVIEVPAGALSVDLSPKMDAVRSVRIAGGALLPLSEVREADFAAIYADKAVSPEEVSAMKESVIRARERLLAAWAVGAVAKSTQKELAKTGLLADYVEPLFKGAGCILLCALMLSASGCLTRTRCQALTFDGCTFNVNEPVGTDDPKYPRSLQIGVNDQQIEGGTDTIASGNKTDPSLQVPMGDSALGYLGQLLGGVVKSNTPAAKAAAAAPAAAAASGSACADGACAVPAAK